MVITSGNYSGQDHPVTEPLTVEGGNWTGANLVNPEGHPVTLRGGNLRGLRFDGVAPASAADLPPWVTLDGGVLHYGWTPQPRLVPLPQAVEILTRTMERTGQDGVNAWLHGVEFILSAPDPGPTEQQWKDNHVAWTRATGNTIYSDAARAAFLTAFFPGLTWEEFVAEIRRYDLATWRGEPTQPEGTV